MEIGGKQYVRPRNRRSRDVRRWVNKWDIEARVKCMDLYWKKMSKNNGPADFTSLRKFTCFSLYNETVITESLIVPQEIKDAMFDLINGVPVYGRAYLRTMFASAAAYEEQYSITFQLVDTVLDNLLDVRFMLPLPVKPGWLFPTTDELADLYFANQHGIVIDDSTILCRECNKIDKPQPFPAVIAVRPLVKAPSVSRRSRRRAARC